MTLEHILWAMTALMVGRVWYLQDQQYKALARRIEELSVAVHELAVSMARDGAKLEALRKERAS